MFNKQLSGEKKALIQGSVTALDGFLLKMFSLWLILSYQHDINKLVNFLKTTGFREPVGVLAHHCPLCCVCPLCLLLWDHGDGKEKSPKNTAGCYNGPQASQVTLMVKNPPANAGDQSLTPGLGRSPGGGMATHSNILAWRIPWTEECGRLQSIGSHRVKT